MIRSPGHQAPDEMTGRHGSKVRLLAEGRWALDVAFGIIASAGAYFSGIPLWRGLREEITGTGQPLRDAGTADRY